MASSPNDTSLSWHGSPTTDVLRSLDVDPDIGLVSEEAQRRLDRDGRNDLGTHTSAPWWPLFARQFTSPLTIILLVAVAISAVLGELLDAAAIGVIVAVNGILGFIQEWRADRAIEALEAMLVPTARVLRDGTLDEVDAALLVRGDIVHIEAGDRVPADLRLLTTPDLMIDESALTGESEATRKNPAPLVDESDLAERSNLAFFGTDVTNGRGVGVVYATGQDTEFGTIAQLTKHVEPAEIPLQRTLADLGRRLGIAAVAIASLTVLGGILDGRPAKEMFFTGVSFAVAVVPEGLPAVVTVTLALGIRSMAKRKALLRNLEAAESLGAASVICTDKTGTLTQNRMTVRKIWTAEGFHLVDKLQGHPLPPTVAALLDTAQHCNHASVVAKDDGLHLLGDPTEAALLVVAQNLDRPRPDGEMQEEIPFSPDTKMMTSVIRTSTDALGPEQPAFKLCAHVKGAPEVILSRCTSIMTGKRTDELDEPTRALVMTNIESLATTGLRTLALAIRPLHHPDETPNDNLTLLGVVGMHDPPRPEVAEAIGESLTAGLDVVVITGDAGGTALAIADEIGLHAESVLTGSTIDDLSDDELRRHLDGSHVLARVTPAHKMRVVRVLQEAGEVVAMTGDGVNDAPALHQASIGVAMGLRGTDVARGAADVVLADDNFASIVAAIREGRRQFANITKFIRYLLSSNLGEVIAISGAVAVGWPLILAPAQILWMNLLTDGVSALALGIEPVEADAMKRRPRRITDSIIDREGLAWIVGCGTIIGLITLGVFYATLGSQVGDDLVRAQTMAFTVMVLLETVNVLNFRSSRLSLRRIGLFSNGWLTLAIVVAIATQGLALYLPGLNTALGTTPLGINDLLVVAGLSLPILAIGELAKLLRRRGSGPQPLGIGTSSPR